MDPIRTKRKPGGVIREVVDQSIAQIAGLRPGDVLAAVNSRPLADIIDYKFHTTEERCRLSIRRNGGTRTVDVCKELDEDLGIRFEDDLFDGIRRCRARCIFCFVDQLPESVRPGLKIKDDDFRLSFLHGDYISLSNLSDDDFARIARQRLSPLYVSVHTTNPALRDKMMRGQSVGEIMEQLRRLTTARIEIHAQIVVCPGRNDGSELEKTVFDLADLHGGVKSVSVVPVGLTRHRRGLPTIGPVTPGMSGEILRAVGLWQKAFRSKLGTRFVFGADELYFLADRRIPGAAAYEGFPQLDNGVGETRLLLQNLARATRRLAAGTAGDLKGGLVTGLMCARIIGAFAERIGAAGAGAMDVIPIENRFLGASVTTAGLIAGRDIIEQIKGRRPCLRGPLYVPKRSLRDGSFIDDVTIQEVEEVLEAPVIPLDLPGDIVRSKPRA